MGDAADEDQRCAEMHDDLDGPKGRKGSLDAECNRTACKEWPASFWNPNTERYYCAPCAVKINQWIPADRPQWRCRHYRDIPAGQPGSGRDCL